MEFSIRFADLDLGLMLPEGMTKEHIEKAVKDTVFEIVSKGLRSADIRRSPSWIEGATKHFRGGAVSR